jgi:hypothetical protein
LPALLTSRALSGRKNWNIFALSIEKIDFQIFGAIKLMVAKKLFHVPAVMSDRFTISFIMFPIVELTKLGGQHFKLDLYSVNLII